MDILSLFGPVAAVLAALVGVAIAARWTPIPAAGRCETIDGLRGFLAFSVFLHHSVVFYFYVNNGTWTLPRSNVYVNMGHASVALFFMITSFLFYGMLRRNFGGSVDWLRVYCSRIMRLTPLYLFAMALLFLIVAIETRWELRVPIGDLLSSIARWLGFTALGMPDINRLDRTSIIMSGVTWSLPYEWVFYLCLPLIALTQRIRVPLIYRVLSMAIVAIVVTYAIIKKPGAHHLAAFVGGIIALHLSTIPALRRFAAHPFASVLLLFTITAAYAGFKSAYSIGSMSLLIASFTLISAGCNLFGVLRSRLARVFGEYAYSIYLLHGIVLYTTFELSIGASRAAEFSPLQYWSIIVGLSPLLVIACSLTFRFIEAPMMKRTNTLLQLIRRPTRPIAAGVRI